MGNGQKRIGKWAKKDWATGKKLIGQQAKKGLGNGQNKDWATGKKRIGQRATYISPLWSHKPMLVRFRPFRRQKASGCSRNNKMGNVDIRSLECKLQLS